MSRLPFTVYRLPLRFIFLSTIYYLLSTVSVYAQEEKPEPTIINGDVVEYSTDSKEFTATGNVEVDYKGVKLTCDKLIMNSETKDAQAEGNARLDDAKGVIEGPKLIYNFNTKQGTIIDSEFRSNPYFGRAEKSRKVSDDEFINYRGYMTTCSYDNPHYRIKFRRMNFFPGDKIQTKDDTFYWGRVPLFYAPQYNHSLRDPLIHVQLMAGKSKTWGPYLLTAWRYSLTEDIKGRIYWDYREQRGVAEGFGVNYNTNEFGKGDFKFYYTQERARDFEEGVAAEFERYLIRLRHKWDIDEKTNAIAEYYKIVDSKRMLHSSEYNILKDFFPREYETDALPLSYVLIHRSFGYSSADLLLQKRTNRWYSQDEKLPEIKYTLPSLQIGETPFYFENSDSYVNFNHKNAVPSPSWDDTTYNKFDTTNKFSLPMKAAFISLTPFASAQQVYYDKSTYGSTLDLNFSTGSDLSTKFYRLFNVQSNFLGLDINGLRHIITPTMTYSYTKNSTTPSGELRIGGGATTSSGSSLSMGLSNKLQTKREGQKVDIADFRINTSYPIKPKTGDKRGSNFSDFLFELELRPYAWLRFDSDVTYKHSGSRSSIDYRKFTGVNYDINFDFGKDRIIGLGQRYQRKGGNDITLSFDWRLSPKWKFGFYQRRNRGHSAATGLREQEYRVSRDLHCWIIDFTYNVSRGQGETIWLIFRLKAFPEMEFEYNQGYHAPKPGSQNP